jgi:coenzyme F420-reducing hydrogenase alpha subunit
VELILAVELSLEIIATLLNFDKRSDKPVTIARQKGSGSASTEAPRGVLIHSYSFDNRGFCTAADIITPTAINQAAMERDLLALAREMEGADDAELKLKLEMLVRAYDPCISCAVHLVRL